MIEKTITQDKTTPSVEHMFSLEEEEAKTFITEIREVEKAIKDTERKLNPDPKKRFATRRSIRVRTVRRTGHDIRRFRIPREKTHSYHTISKKS